MKPTKVLQEIRKMRFEEAYESKGGQIPPTVICSTIKRDAHPSVTTWPGVSLVERSAKRIT